MNVLSEKIDIKFQYYKVHGMDISHISFQTCRYFLC